MGFTVECDVPRSVCSISALCLSGLMCDAGVTLSSVTTWLFVDTTLASVVTFRGFRLSTLGVDGVVSVRVCVLSVSTDVWKLTLFMWFVVVEYSLVCRLTWLCFNVAVQLNNVMFELQPWSCGYRRRLMIKRSWVWIPGPDTRWQLFHI